MSLNKDTIKTIIADHQDNRKNLWTAFIVLTGAIGTLVISIDSVIKAVLFGIGILSEIGLVYFIMTNNKMIDTNINMLVKQDKEEN